MQRPTRQTPSHRHVLRQVWRGLAVLGATSVAVLATALSAHADTPAGWEDAPGVSGLDFLIVLFLIPAGLALVISLLAALPSMIGEKGYEPGQAWRSEPEWFGGPRRGLEKGDAEPEASDQGTGGTSARW